MNDDERDALVAAVQANCDIADARHAVDLTLCIYLLQMREFFRWQRGLSFGAALPRDAVGTWISERETLWSSLESHAFRRLPCPGRADGFDPFDVDAVNRLLHPAGLLYGAGMVGADRPVFFLAELHGHAVRDGLRVLSAGRELARGLAAPPGVLADAADGASIVLRREALAGWCWDKFETFTLRRTAGSALQAMVEAYGLDRDFEAALPRWLDEQGEAVVLHELGEHRAGRWLGPAWVAMRLALASRRAELHARAVRDHLADLEVTLPTLLERGAAASIHVWFASYEGVREAMFPSLATAYRDWRGGDAGRSLRRAIAAGTVHFRALARDVLERSARGGEGAATAIEGLLTAPAAVCRP